MKTMLKLLGIIVLVLVIAFAAACGGGNTGKTSSLSSADPCIHQWGEWTQTRAPSCTMKGIEVQTCTICGEVSPQTRSIQALGHAFIEDEINCLRCKLSRRRCLG